MRANMIPERAGGSTQDERPLALIAWLAGTFEDPILRSELRVREGAPQQLPFEQLQATLAYAQRQLQGNVQIQQMDRQVLALELRLPVELAFTALPWPQRLVDAPLALSVEVTQPRLAAFHRWRPALPPLSGTVQGTLGVQGTYATLALDADMQLHELGVGDIAKDGALLAGADRSNIFYRVTGSAP
jgi:hypothetical protein